MEQTEQKAEEKKRATRGRGKKPKSGSGKKGAAAAPVMDPLSGRMTRPFRGRRTGSGPSTGLRAVTMLVVHLLNSSSSLSYESIANQVCERLRTSDLVSEARNIRRRAYDVINVMAAVGFIHKHKKRLFSVESLTDPSGNVNPEPLIREREERKQRIATKQQAVNDLIKRQKELEQQMRDNQTVGTRKRIRRRGKRQLDASQEAEEAVIYIKSEPVSPTRHEQQESVHQIVPEYQDIETQSQSQQPPQQETPVIQVPEPVFRQEGQNVIVQQIDYLFAPTGSGFSYIYQPITGMDCGVGQNGVVVQQAYDPNLQAACTTGYTGDYGYRVVSGTDDDLRTGTENEEEEDEEEVEVEETDYNRDPVEAILSAFY